MAVRFCSLSVIRKEFNAETRGRKDVYWKKPAMVARNGFVKVCFNLGTAPSMKFFCSSGCESAQSKKSEPIYIGCYEKS
jgi:hypothetical protein